MNQKEINKEEGFYNCLVNLCDKSVQSILKFNNHKIPQEIQHLYQHSTNQHRSIIYSLINYHWYNEILWWEQSSDLLIKMVKQQSLPNGNKRQAILLFTLFLNKYSIFMDFSNSNEWINLVNKIAISNYKDIKNEVISFIESKFCFYTNEQWSGDDKDIINYPYLSYLINKLSKM